MLINVIFCLGNMRVYYFLTRVDITRRRQNKYTYTVTGTGNIYQKNEYSVEKEQRKREKVQNIDPRGQARVAFR